MQRQVQVEDAVGKAHRDRPDGSRWTNAWTAEPVPGGTEVTADAPLSQIPLFLRDGAALPISAPR